MSVMMEYFNKIFLTHKIQNFKISPNSELYPILVAKCKDADKTNKSFIFKYKQVNK